MDWTPRTHEERRFADPLPSECPAIHGGMVGYVLCELPRGHQGWHHDTDVSGKVWHWQKASEIAGCTPDGQTGLTGHYASVECRHG